MEEESSQATEAMMKTRQTVLPVTGFTPKRKQAGLGSPCLLSLSCKTKYTRI